MILIGPLQFKLFYDSGYFIDALFLFLNVAFAWNILCNRNMSSPSLYARTSDYFSHLTWA